MGAYLNVRINLPGLTNKDAAAAYLDRGRALEDEAIGKETAILALVNGHL